MIIISQLFWNFVTNSKKYISATQCRLETVPKKLESKKRSLNSSINSGGNPINSHRSYIFTSKSRKIVSRNIIAIAAFGKASPNILIKSICRSVEAYINKFSSLPILTLSITFCSIYFRFEIIAIGIRYWLFIHVVVWIWQ